MRPAQHRAVPDTPRPKLLLSRAIRALTARKPFGSHSTTDAAGYKRLRTATHQHFRWSEPMWSPPPESNRRPHPYHESCAHRCADRRFRSSLATVDRQVMCSTGGGSWFGSPAPLATLILARPTSSRGRRKLPRHDRRGLSPKDPGPGGYRPPSSFNLRVNMLGRLCRRCTQVV